MKISTSGNHKISTNNIEILDGVNVNVTSDITDDLTVTLNRDSVLNYHAKLSSSNKTIKFILKGPGASIKVRITCEGRDDSINKITTVQHHVAPDTTSDLEIRGVFYDSAKFFANNLIRIDKDAQRIVAREDNKNLLLGDNARVVTIPKLEVEADDVSAQHGAAISRLNDEQLFYLQSRGMEPTLAKKFLIEAFLNI